jgi:aspartate aminotransferase
MIKINKSGARYSAIVGIGEKLRKMSSESGQEYLMLNRGINAVVNIDLSPLIPEIDFNSNEIQVYPPVKGRPSLREAINKEFFNNASSIEHIYITAGGVNALDLIFKTLDVDKVLLPQLYWGAYVNVLKINNKPFDFYTDMDFLIQNAPLLKGSAVILCDPNNPSGAKFDDKDLYHAIKMLNGEGVVVIFDSPYRRVFYEADEDDFYQRLLEFEHVIISESFSKSLGLSGMRIGFVHSLNKDFMEELAIKLLFATNGINNFAQLIIEKLLTTPQGRQSALAFRETTREHILKNIIYLEERKFLATEFYPGGKPMGIFVIVNLSYEQLLAKRIGSVPLNFFTQMNTIEVEKYARICVSVPSASFTRYFDQINQPL